MEMLKNYKIKVNNEAESKEAQELFFELGYEWNVSGKEVVSWRLGLLFTKEFQGKNCLCYFDKDKEALFGECIGEELTLHQLLDLVAQSKNEQGLISGADALRALADGESVEFFYRGVWDSIGEMIVIDHFVSDRFKFRIKPSTITLNGIEIPTPFEPKVGEDFYFIDCETNRGYSTDTVGNYGVDYKNWSQFGAWRTESEIKQVVAALRSVFK